MPRLIKQGRPFKPVKIVVAKGGEPPKVVKAMTRQGRYKKPPAPKKAKPIKTPDQDVGPFKGKF